MKNYTKCRSCGLFQTLKINNFLCSYCNPDKKTKRLKTKELKKHFYKNKVINLHKV